MAYSEKVMDHFANPRNVGEIPDADGIGEVGNSKCGDIMKMYIKVEDNRIVDVKFKTFGCGAAIATSSMATELIKGKTIDEALKLTNKAVMEALDGLPPVKVHCSVLAEQAIKIKAIGEEARLMLGRTPGALADYYKKNGIDPTPIIGEIGDCDDCHCH
jgi:nitrogen fixation NifU-like protein